MAEEKSVKGIIDAITHAVGVVLVGGALEAIAVVTLRSQIHKLGLEQYEWIIFISLFILFIAVIYGLKLIPRILISTKEIVLFFYKARAIVLLAKNWSPILNKPSNKNNRKLKETYLNTYLRNESANIKDGQYIYTNFICYADIVEDLVKKANYLIRKDKDKEVICLTTLILNPYKWFNFNDGRNGFSVNKDWEKYKDFIREMRTNTRILRYLIGYDDSIPRNEEIKAKYDLSLKSKKDIQDELDSYICTEPTSLKPLTIDGEQFQCLAGSPISDSLKKYIERKYKAVLLQERDEKTGKYSKVAYFIFPNEYANDIATIEAHLPAKCKKVMAVLASEYQEVSDFHPFFFGEDRYTNLLDYHFVNPKNEMPPRNEIPEDFFVIGIKNKFSPIEYTKWKFGIGATVDHDLDKAKLYFFYCDQDVPPESSAIRFNTVLRFINSRLLPLART